MTKSKIIFFFMLLVTSVQGQNATSDKSDFLDATTKWFKAWELVSKKTYGLKTLKPTDFVLFDEKFIYTTSKIVGEGGQVVAGPKNYWIKNLLGTKKPIRIALHFLTDKKEKRI